MARQRNRNTKTTPITAGTTVRFEQPKSKRKPKTKVVAVVAQEINPVGGFVGFLREHAIVGLAVGFAIATQVQVVVKQLIASFIDPLYGLLLNGEKLTSQKASLHWHGRAQEFGWGAFVYTLIDFLFVLAVIYAVIKFFNLDQLDKPKDDKK